MIQVDVLKKRLARASLLDNPSDGSDTQGDSGAAIEPRLDSRLELHGSR